VVNPNWDSGKLKLFDKALPELPELSGHIFIPTSSSTGSVDSLKIVALSKEAFLASANAVNSHIGFCSQDTWLNPLPLFHVGGLSTYARAWLSGGNVVDCFQVRKWDVKLFYDQLIQSAASFTSVVPTQLFDLVKAGLKAPGSLRGAITGGGKLEDGLLRDALTLGWPVLCSYGMTECASQIATGTYEHPDKMIPLAHVLINFSKEGLLRVKSPSLCSGILQVEGDNFNFFDPRDKDGYYTTQDLGELKNGALKIHGRQDDQIKISGELVSLQELESLLSDICEKEAKVESKHFALLPLPCSRLGNKICLVYQSEVRLSSIDKIKELFNNKVFAPARIKELCMVAVIPRSELFKIKRKELKDLVTKNLKID
jgi:O-succinylbenzoic acid--CoA ligase